MGKPSSVTPWTWPVPGALTGEQYELQRQMGDAVPAVELIAAADPMFLLVSVDVVQRTLVLWRRGDMPLPAAILDRCRQAVPTGVDIRLATSLFDRHTLQSCRSRISELQGRFLSLGFRIRGYGLLESGGPLTVFYESTRADSSELRSYAGAEVAEITALARGHIVFKSGTIHGAGSTSAS